MVALALAGGILAALLPAWRAYRLDVAATWPKVNHMHRLLVYYCGTLLFALAPSDYSAALLPDINGVVSWKTLAQVEPVREGGKMVLRFSKDILGLDKQDVRVQGFIIPLEMSDKQKRFLLSAVPPHCPFCMPAGPDAIVEVLAKKPVSYSFEPIIVSGKFAVLKDDPTGVLYRMSDAEPVASPTK